MNQYVNRSLHFNRFKTLSLPIVVLVVLITLRVEYAQLLRPCAFSIIVTSINFIAFATNRNANAQARVVASVIAAIPMVVIAIAEKNFFTPNYEMLPIYGGFIGFMYLFVSTELHSFFERNKSFENFMSAITAAMCFSMVLK